LQNHTQQQKYNPNIKWESSLRPYNVIYEDEQLRILKNVKMKIKNTKTIQSNPKHQIGVSTITNCPKPPQQVLDFSVPILYSTSIVKSGENKTLHRIKEIQILKT